MLQVLGMAGIGHIEDGSAVALFLAIERIDSLAALVSTLGDDDLARPSGATDWDIAQVLSHIGSGAEIFGLLLDAGLSGAEPPGGDTFPAIWQAWNERGPQVEKGRW